VTAGYAKNDGNAARLNGNEKVRSRNEELLSEGAAKAGVTVQRIVDELAKVGFANMGDYLHATTGGDPFFVYDQLTDEQKAALSEVTVEDFKDGRGEDARDVRRIKVELTGKDGKDSDWQDRDFRLIRGSFAYLPRSTLCEQPADWNRSPPPSAHRRSAQMDEVARPALTGESDG
jgi:hypothetical protein